MSQPVAIETYYGGWRFRSRTEARWAIYWDTLGIRWEYEREGYVLPNGMRYLPDFWLETVHMWAEVKPGPFTPEERLKCKLLVEATGFGCLMLDGSPDDLAYMGYWPHANEDSGDIEAWEMDFVLEEGHHYPTTRGSFFTQSGTDDRHEAWTYAAFNVVGPGKAVQAARSARFEYGETPRPPERREEATG